MSQLIATQERKEAHHEEVIQKITESWVTLVNV